MSIKEQIIWTGMLFKSPPIKKVDDSTGFKKWEDRFFELVFLRDEDHHVLRYYNDAMKSKLKKEISLAPDSECKLVTNIASKTQKNVFCLILPKRRLYMSAQSDRTAKQWFKELVAACPYLALVDDPTLLDKDQDEQQQHEQEQQHQIEDSNEQERRKDNAKDKQQQENDQQQKWQKQQQQQQQQKQQVIEDYVPPVDDTNSFAAYDTLDQLVYDKTANGSDEPQLYVDMSAPTDTIQKRMNRISQAYTDNVLYGNWEPQAANETAQAMKNENSDDLLWSGTTTQTKRESEIEERERREKREREREERERESSPVLPLMPSRELKKKVTSAPALPKDDDLLCYVDLSKSQQDQDPFEFDNTKAEIEYADIDANRTKSLELAKKSSLTHYDANAETVRQTRHSHDSGFDSFGMDATASTTSRSKPTGQNLGRMRSQQMMDEFQDENEGLGYVDDLLSSLMQDEGDVEQRSKAAVFIPPTSSTSARPPAYVNISVQKQKS